MSDRSDEVSVSRESEMRSDSGADETSGSYSTEDLLEQTERLLEGSRSESKSESSPNTNASTDSETGLEGDPADTAADIETGADTESTDSSRWWLPSWGSSKGASESSPSRTRSMLSWLSLSTYFSPKAYLALVLALTAGLLAGSMVIPFAGTLVGMFAVSFAVGLFTTRRRYNEMIAAGGSIGGISALADYTIPLLSGVGGSFVAVGATAGLLASLVGYYFGRDLQNGTTRTIE